MRRMIIIVILFAAQLFSQNLLTNPGFESGMTGWENIWTRTPGTGELIVVTSPVHSGIGAMRISHTGSDNWSFKPVTTSLIAPGDIYEFSAYIRIDSTGLSSDISIALFDSAGINIDWYIAKTELQNTMGNYQRFVTRFQVPPHGGKMWTRFTGSGNCRIYIDDVELKLLGRGAGGNLYYLNNNKLSVEIASSSFALNITDKINMKNYIVNPAQGFIVNSVDSSMNTFTFHSTIASDWQPADISISLISDGLKFEISAPSNSALSSDLQFPGNIESNAGDYLIISYAGGMILPSDEIFPFYSLPLYAYKATMTFMGVTDLNSGYILIADTPWDAEIKLTKKTGSVYNSPKLYYHASKGKFGYNRISYLRFFESGGYNEMAKKYREFAESKGYVKTFDVKIADNPNITKLMEQLIFGFRIVNFLNPNLLIHYIITALTELYIHLVQVG